MLSVRVSLLFASAVQFSSSLAVAIFPIFNGQLVGQPWDALGCRPFHQQLGLWFTQLGALGQIIQIRSG